MTMETTIIYMEIEELEKVLFNYYRNIKEDKTVDEIKIYPNRNPSMKGPLIVSVSHANFADKLNKGFE